MIVLHNITQKEPTYARFTSETCVLATLSNLKFMCAKVITYSPYKVNAAVKCESTLCLSLVDTTGRSPLLHATNSPFHGSTVSGDSGGGGLSHPASPMKGKYNNAAVIGSPAASGRRRDISTERDQV